MVCNFEQLHYKEFIPTHLLLFSPVCVSVSPFNLF